MTPTSSSLVTFSDCYLLAPWNVNECMRHAKAGDKTAVQVIHAVNWTLGEIKKDKENAGCALLDCSNPKERFTGDHLPFAFVVLLPNEPTTPGTHRFVMPLCRYCAMRDDLREAVLAMLCDVGVLEPMQIH